MPKVSFRSVVKYINKEAYRQQENASPLSICELESFIALQDAGRLYGKNHPLPFLYNETYGIFRNNTT